LRESGAVTRPCARAAAQRGRALQVQLYVAAASGSGCVQSRGTARSVHTASAAHVCEPSAHLEGPVALSFQKQRHRNSQQL
jgi:hypothetical protein